MSNLGWQHLTRSDKEQIVRGVRDGVAYGGPYHVEFYPADRCNISCFFCSTAAIRGTDELPLQRFEELIAELGTLGTRAIRLAGGGEPLFHRRIADIIRAANRAGIRIENVTTNAVLLAGEIADLLLEGADQITVSLNTADAQSYGEMMRTPERNFDRVLQNVRDLIAARKKTGRRFPEINLQFLVWRDNYRSIPRMYALARELDVDSILFSGLAFLKPEQEMNDVEVAEMMRLYEEVIREDEFRRITNIGSFERDIEGDLGAIIQRLDRERRSAGIVRRALNFATRGDSLAAKVRHHLRARRDARATQQTADFDEACVIGWHSMVVRSDGSVAPCCMLQGKSLGNVLRQSVKEVWYGEPYQAFRNELTRIIGRGDTWSASDDDHTVESICALKGTNLCPMKSFYFRRDTPFVRALGETFTSIASRAS